MPTPQGFRDKQGREYVYINQGNMAPDQVEAVGKQHVLDYLNSGKTGYHVGDDYIISPAGGFQAGYARNIGAPLQAGIGAMRSWEESRPADPFIQELNEGVASAGVSGYQFKQGTPLTSLANIVVDPLKSPQGAATMLGTMALAMATRGTVNPLTMNIAKTASGRFLQNNAPGLVGGAIAGAGELLGAYDPNLADAGVKAMTVMGLTRLGQAISNTLKGPLDDRVQQKMKDELAQVIEKSGFLAPGISGAKGANPKAYLDEMLKVADKYYSAGETARYDQVLSRAKQLFGKEEFGHFETALGTYMDARKAVFAYEPGKDNLNDLAGKMHTAMLDVARTLNQNPTLPSTVISDVLARDPQLAPVLKDALQRQYPALARNAALLDDPKRLSQALESTQIYKQILTPAQRDQALAPILQDSARLASGGKLSQDFAGFLQGEQEAAVRGVQAKMLTGMIREAYDPQSGQFNAQRLQHFLKNNAHHYNDLENAVGMVNRAAFRGAANEMDQISKAGRPAEWVQAVMGAVPGLKHVAPLLRSGSSTNYAGTLGLTSPNLATVLTPLTSGSNGPLNDTVYTELLKNFGN